MTIRISSRTEIESLSKNLSLVRNDTALINGAEDLFHNNFQLLVTIGGLIGFFLLVTMNITLCFINSDIRGSLQSEKRSTLSRKYRTDVMNTAIIDWIVRDWRRRKEESKVGEDVTKFSQKSSSAEIDTLRSNNLKDDSGSNHEEINTEHSSPAKDRSSVENTTSNEEISSSDDEAYDNDIAKERRTERKQPLFRSRTKPIPRPRQRTLGSEEQETCKKHSFHKSSVVKKNKIERNLSNALAHDSARGNRFDSTLETTKGKGRILSYPQLQNEDHVIVSRCIHSLSAIPRLVECCSDDQTCEQTTETDTARSQSEIETADSSATHELCTFPCSLIGPRNFENNGLKICRKCKMPLHTERNYEVYEHTQSTTSLSDDRVVVSQHRKRHLKGQSSHGQNLNSKEIAKVHKSNLTSTTSATARQRVSHNTPRPSTLSKESHNRYVFEQNNTRYDPRTRPQSINQDHQSNVNTNIFEHSFVVPVFSPRRGSKQFHSNKSGFRDYEVNGRTNMVQKLHVDSKDTYSRSDKLTSESSQTGSKRDEKNRIVDSHPLNSVSTTQTSSAFRHPGMKKTDENTTGEQITLSIPAHQSSVPLTLVVGKTGSFADGARSEETATKHFISDGFMTDGQRPCDAYEETKNFQSNELGFGTEPKTKLSLSLDQNSIPQFIKLHEKNGSYATLSRHGMATSSSGEMRRVSQQDASLNRFTPGFASSTVQFSENVDHRSANDIPSVRCTDVIQNMQSPKQYASSHTNKNSETRFEACVTNSTREPMVTTSNTQTMRGNETATNALSQNEMIRNALNQRRLHMRPSLSAVTTRQSLDDLLELERSLIGNPTTNSSSKLIRDKTENRAHDGSNIPQANVTQPKSVCNETSTGVSNTTYPSPIQTSRLLSDPNKCFWKPREPFPPPPPPLPTPWKKFESTVSSLATELTEQQQNEIERLIYKQLHSNRHNPLTGHS